MPQKLYRQWLRLLFLLLLLGGALLLPAPAVLHAAPDDTPTPVAQEYVSLWTVNDGLVYWARNCLGGSPELRGPGFLRRAPAVGGTALTLATVAAEQCMTYRALSGAPEGVYYYNDDANRFEFRASGSPTDPPTVVLSDTIGALDNSQMRFNGDYFYWLARNNTIQRAKKEGIGQETVATGTPGAHSLQLGAFNSVVWLDDNGFWTTDTNCATRPCAKTPIQSSFGGYRPDYLLQTVSSFSASEFYWVERQPGEIVTLPDRIRHYACSLAGCTLETFYTAPTGWVIGTPAFKDNQLFWTERLPSNVTPDGRLQRKAVGSNEAVTLLDNRPTLDPARLFIEGNWLFFGDFGFSTPGIFRLPLDATALVRDIVVDGVEVTQGIQDLANNVPGVAHKSTYVRAFAHVASGPQVVAAEAWLYGTRNGQPLPYSPLAPIQYPSALRSTFNRSDSKDGWLFQLPASWTAAMGDVTFRLVVDPRGIIAESNRSNNEQSVGYHFENKAPLCTIYVPVRTNAPRADIDAPNFPAMVDTAKRHGPLSDFWTYRQSEPVEELEICFALGFIPYPCYGPYELPDDGWKVLLALNVRDAFTDDPDECDAHNAISYYVGLVHNQTDTSNPKKGTITNGAANFNDNVAWFKLPDPANPTAADLTDPAWPDKGTTYAHELGHSFDRKHVNSGNNEDGTDDNYPYSGGAFAPNDGQEGYMGFDPKTHKVFAPTLGMTGDIMSYARPRWPSDYTWQGMMIYAPDEYVTAAATTLVSAVNAIFVSGAITPTTNSGLLNYAWLYPTTALSDGQRRKWQQIANQEAPPLARYHLQLLDSNNGVLADTPVVLQISDDDEQKSAAAIFVAVFAAPASPVARLQLMDGNTVLAALVPSAATPTVTISQPTGGAMVDGALTITWQASDADGNDALLHTIQYSPDNGAHWQILATEVPTLPSQPQTLTLHKANAIPGSNGASALVRVLTSDGYQTGMATSQPFTVKNRKPVSTIIAPTDGQWLPADVPVQLRGRGDDAEDGGLAAAALHWAVDGTSVGNGMEVEVTTLAPGDHLVALTAMDALSQTATTSVTVHMAPLTIPLGETPTLNGQCDDASYANAAQVMLAGYPGGGQAWARLLRSSDALWLCFTGLNTDTLPVNDYLGLWVDVNNSRDGQSQSSDFGFFVGEDGGHFTRQGDGVGGFTTGPGGLQAQVQVENQHWQAELRMDADQLGGWGHLAGLAVGHYDLNANDLYRWPLTANATQPATWATSALGDQPQITALAPYTTTVAAATFTLTVKGAGFDNGTALLWDGNPVATTYISSTQLSATISNTLLASAGERAVTVRNAASGNLQSTPDHFLVLNGAPTITQLNPPSAQVQTTGLLLTMSGQNFINGAQVVWNRQLLPATVVNSSQLTVQIPATLLSQGQVVDIAVRNPAPATALSNTMGFHIAPATVPVQPHLYLPLVRR